ncbi:hypothetical protein [Streptomyces sp. NPDC056296]|uniref:hypothetical protein n=1 Tax=Streptomyces sp. NPDC056296 TaxID=3345775 RepID=UPI0035E2C1E3
MQRLLKPSRGFQVGCGVCDDVIQLGQFRLQGPDFHLCPALALVIVHRLEAQIAGVLVVSTLGIDTLLAGRAQADWQGVEDLDGGHQTFHSTYLGCDRASRAAVFLKEMFQVRHLLGRAPELAGDVPVGNGQGGVVSRGRPGRCASFSNALDFSCQSSTAFVDGIELALQLAACCGDLLCAVGEGQAQVLGDSGDGLQSAFPDLPAHGLGLVSTPFRLCELEVPVRLGGSGLGES